MTLVQRAPALLLLALLSQPLLAIGIGREMPVTPPSIEPAPGERYAPKIASNGDGFLVVWYDRRGGASEVRATRLDADGAVIDPASILIATDAGSAISVASNGQDYLVAFGCDGSVTRSVCLSRVDAENGLALRSPAVEGMNGALASNGEGYLLLYQRAAAQGTQPVMGVPLRDDGTVRGAPFQIHYSAFAPAVAANGDAYFVVWSTYANLEGVLVSEEELLGTPQRLTTTVPSWGPGPFSWSVASNGAGFLVAWQQNTGVAGNAYTTELRVRTVTFEGIAGSGRAVAGEGAWQPSLTGTPSGYALAYTHSPTPAGAPYLGWDSEGDIRALTLTAAGEATGEPAVQAATAGRESAPAAASNGTKTLIAWENIQHPRSALIESAALGEPDPVVVSTSVAWQQNLAVTRDTARTLIAFEETAGREQRSRVVLHQYEANTGVPRGRATFTVQSSEKHQRHPAMGFSLIAWVEQELDGTGAAVWWQQLADYRMGSDYDPQGTAKYAADAMPDTPIHVLNEHVFHVILWTAPDGRLKGVRKQLITRVGFDPSTFYVTTDTAINPSSDGYTPSFEGGAHLIAYNHPVAEACPIPCPPRNSIRATVLAGMGPAKAIDIAPPGASAPRVVDVGAEYLVFWSMDGGGTYAQRVTTLSGAAQLIGGPVRIHDGIFHDAVAAADGEAFAVVTERDRFVLLQLDRQLNVREATPFGARLAGDARIRLGGMPLTAPIMAYAAPRPNDGASSRAVFRLIGDDEIPVRRRTVR